MGEVIRLPSAASRKVLNPVGFGLKSLVENLPAHPAKWNDHGGRKAWQEARFDRSPEMMVIAAMFSLLSAESKAQVRRKIAGIADTTGSPHAVTALHIVECVK